MSYSDPYGLCPKDQGGDGSSEFLHDCPVGSEGYKAFRDAESKDKPLERPTVDPVAVMSGFIGGLLKSGATAATTTFFRGVSSQEAGQIGATGTLQPAAGQVGKYLTNSVEAAAEWGRRLHGANFGGVAEVRVPTTAVRAMEALGRIDGIGQAWFARTETLSNAVARMMR